jgi:hypothetical protein
MKFRAEVIVELPEDLNKYTGAEAGLPVSYVQGLAKMHLMLDLNNALHQYGMDAKAVSVVKAQA